MPRAHAATCRCHRCVVGRSPSIAGSRSASVEKSPARVVKDPVEEAPVVMDGVDLDFIMKRINKLEMENVNLRRDLVQAHDLLHREKEAMEVSYDSLFDTYQSLYAVGSENLTLGHHPDWRY